MGDSDEDFDRRRGRDKFRGERNDYERRPRDYRDSRRGGRDDSSWQDRKRNDSNWEWPDKRPRDQWESRKRNDVTGGTGAGGGGGYYRDMERNRRDSGGRPGSPPIKRMRRDWNNEDFHGGHGGGGGMVQGNMGMWPHGDGAMHSMDKPPRPDGGFHENQPEIPKIMSFKEFLMAQEDDINETESVRRYKEYTLEFKRTQISDFFVLHKTEEWLKEKYHPIDKKNKQQETRQSLKKRLRVFLDLLENGDVDKLSLDNEKQDELIKFMDTVVIKLEGGGPAEIALLESAHTEDTSPKPEVATGDAQATNDASDSDLKNQKDDEAGVAASNADGDSNKANEKPSRRDSAYSEADDVELDSESEPETEGMSHQRETVPATTADEDVKDNKSSTVDADTTSTNSPVKESNENVDSTETGLSTSENTEAEAVDNPTGAEKDSVDKEGKEIEPISTENSAQVEPAVTSPLHNTVSLFIRHVTPAITKAEITTVCKRYPGFMRVTLSEPSPERRFSRRGWVTFRPDVDIKNICWTLSNIRIKDSELNPIVNRELAKRVRPISSLTMTKYVSRSDVDVAIELIKALDNKHQLYVKDEIINPNEDKPTESNDDVAMSSDKIDDKKKEDSSTAESTAALTAADDGESVDPEKEANSQPIKQDIIILPDENPVLLSVDVSLLPSKEAEIIESEEQGAVGTDDAVPNSTENKGKEQLIGVEPASEIHKVLDKLLLYLRIVHSIDYYNGTEYAYEDEMPNRCGIIHVRGAAPENATLKEAEEWLNNLNQKLSPHWKKAPEPLSDEDAVTMGKKKIDIETENFVKANSQEIGPEKWLCPLSGKKFRGHEFVRKHIFNKHGHKVEEVKQEVEYFNTYLYDPNRPHFPPPPTGPPKQSPMHHTPMGMNARGGAQWPHRGPRMFTPRNTYTPQFGNFPAPDHFNRGGHNTFPPKPRGSAPHHRDPRQIVQYHDLDAPAENDFF